MELGEISHVSRWGASGTVYGVCAGPGANSITCTQHPVGVQVFDLSSGTCTHSWSLKSKKPKFSAKVLWRCTFMDYSEFVNILF